MMLIWPLAYYRHGDPVTPELAGPSRRGNAAIREAIESGTAHALVVTDGTWLNHR
jgi:hypothetical protein